MSRQSKDWPRLTDGLCLFIALIVLTACVVHPRKSGDYFVALAAGSDIMAGILWQPDDWSFTTGNRTWINHNWGGGYIFHVFYSNLGGNGIILLRFLIIFGTAAGYAVFCRKRGVSWLAALLAIAFTFFVARMDLILRPNLLTLLLCPFWLLILYESTRNRKVIFLMPLIMLLWSNVHGGFILGLAMFAVWFVVDIVMSMISFGARDTFRSHRPTLIAIILTALIVVFINPYGYKNIVYAIYMTKSPVFGTIMEWAPIFSFNKDGLWFYWEFVLLLVVLAGLLLSRGVIEGIGPFGNMFKNSSKRSSWILFEIVFYAIAIVMALSSRRYAHTVALLVTPVLALQFDWLFQKTRRHWALPALAAAVIAMLLLFSPHRSFIPYMPNNPIKPEQTFYERMIGAEAFPDNAVAFINENQIEGRVYNEWAWEGYLRLNCPQLKLFAGGRGHQIYDEEVYKQNQSIMQGRLAPELLRTWDVHIVILPVSPDYDGLISALAFGPQPGWVIIYYSLKAIILADTADPDTLPLIQNAIKGDLHYPDEYSRSMSRAMMLLCPLIEVGDDEILACAINANTLFPSPPMYKLFRMLGDKAPSWNVSYLEDEERRLKDMPINVAGGIMRLRSLEVVTAELEGHFLEKGNVEKSEHYRAQKEALMNQRKNLMKFWN